MKVSIPAGAPETAPQTDRILLALCALVLSSVAVSTYVDLHTQRAYAASDEPAAAQRTAYSAAVRENYNFSFGADKPFLPSNATTDNGEFIDSKSFLPASYCGHCHQEAHAEWRQSAHANSFRTPWYVKNVNMLIHERGIAYARHCEGCHNPIALTSGAMTEHSPINRGFDKDGITCSVCHSIQKVDSYGTGSYVLAQPTALLDENGKPIYGEVPDKEILAHLDRHDKAVMKDFYRTSEYCSVCHKAALPRSVNNYKWQRAFSVYDEWQLSSFAKESPLPFYVKDHVSNCASCHMKPEKIQLPDYGAVDGKLASHRWIAANTVIPKFYGYDVQLQKTMDFLRSGVLNVDLFGIERNGGKLIAPLGSEPYSIAPGDMLTVSVVIQNKGIGHSLVPEQRDFYQCWVEFEAKDAGGHTLMHSGELDTGDNLDPSAHSFTNRLINAQGGLNDLHQVWDTRVVAYNNTIQSGRSQIVRYEFKVPADAVGPISITAKVNYRRFNQHFIDYGIGRHYEIPTVEIAARTLSIALGVNPATPPDARDNPEWMRWNNYGIGLLDAQQYAESAQAFERVEQMRPDYADAYTNVAIADFQWERYAAARASLEKALRLTPHNARALYYLALVERTQGNVDAAIADLRQASTEFPRSRDVLRELGFSYYQEHKYDEARAEYETLQTIDPDDLAAHYVLSIIYRRLGMTAEARRESAAFADQKDDPTASTYALEYLRKHPEITSESVAWHVHSNVTAQPATGEGAGAQ